MKRTITFLSLILLLYSSDAVAQVLQLRGIVRDEKGPLQGVSILVKGTSTGGQTDASGRFAIQASKGNTLEFSSLNFLPQEVVVGDTRVLTITMVSDVEALQSVVVIGYGTKKRQHLSGSVATVG